MRPRTPWDIPERTVEQLTETAAHDLKVAVRDVLKGKSETAIQSALSLLTSSAIHFCELEVHHAEVRARQKEIDSELVKLKRRTTSFLRFLNGVSPYARQNVDLYLPEPIEVSEHFFPAEPAPPSSDPKQTLRQLPASSSNLHSRYINSVVENLTEMLKEVDASLSITRELNKEDKGGAPFRAAWYQLACQVRDVMRDHLAIEPSTTSESEFEQLFRACLEAGLITIRSKAQVPKDLRQYTRLAICGLSKKQA